MKKRIKWLCWSVMLFPVLFGFWILIGLFFICVPIIAFVSPDIFDKKEEQ